MLLLEFFVFTYELIHAWSTYILLTLHVKYFVYVTSGLLKYFFKWKFKKTNTLKI